MMMMILQMIIFSRYNLILIKMYAIKYFFYVSDLDSEAFGVSREELEALDDDNQDTFTLPLPPGLTSMQELNNRQIGDLSSFLPISLPMATSSSDKSAMTALKDQTHVSSEDKYNGYFLPSSSFTGSRQGYIYTLGPQGLGYYIDTITQTSPAPLAPRPSSTASSSDVQDNNSKHDPNTILESQQPLVNNTATENKTSASGSAKPPPPRPPGPPPPWAFKQK